MKFWHILKTAFIDPFNTDVTLQFLYYSSIIKEIPLKLMCEVARQKTSTNSAEQLARAISDADEDSYTQI